MILRLDVYTFATRKLRFSDGQFPSQNSQNSVTNNFLTDFATLRKSVVMMGSEKFSEGISIPSLIAADDF